MSADDHRAKFAEFLRTQPMTAGLTREDVERATTREELGISSLNMILLLVNYIKEEANDSVQLRPEWVSRLGSVDGIVSVVREIDESALAAAK